MNVFLNQFIKKGGIFSANKLPENDNWRFDLDIIKLTRKIIFKNDVVLDFKSMLVSACSLEQFTVQNVVVKKLIRSLHSTISSDLGKDIKLEIFNTIFQSFILCCKDDYVFVFKFFIILCHLLGLTVSQIQKKISLEAGDIILNEDRFQAVFKVNISKPSESSFQILNELLVVMARSNCNLHSPEMQPYNKWFFHLIKNIAKSQFFYPDILEIFSTCAEIDVIILEANLEHIFRKIFTEDQFHHETFTAVYKKFLMKTLSKCANFQLGAKFISKFLSSTKSATKAITLEKILPPDVITEFSKTVVFTSSQQSLLLLEILVQELQKSFNFFIEGITEDYSTLLPVVCEFLITFLKEVKLFASAVSLSTIHSLMMNLCLLKNILKCFGDFLFGKPYLILENEVVFKKFLTLCYYCDEIHFLIDCYKDSITDSVCPTSTNNDKWQFCLDVKQWEAFVEIAVKLQLVNHDIICFQLVSQRLRISNFEKETPQIEDSTRQLILAQFVVDGSTLDIFRLIRAEDLVRLLDILNKEDSKLVVKQLFRKILENEENNQVTIWLSDSRLYENSVFVKHLFSEILKETAFIFSKALPVKKAVVFNWLSEEYFDSENNLDVTGLNSVSEKINYILKKQKKIRKFFKTSETSFIWVVKVFRYLPLVHTGENLARLGLSFAVTVAVMFLDETNDFLLLETIFSFLGSGVDVSVCFNIGYFIKWLGELECHDKLTDKFRFKIIEELVRSTPNNKFGLIQIAEAVQAESFEKMSALRTLETQVVLYQELGKCWQRAKKRKSENDIIGNYRNKLVKLISESVKKFDETDIGQDNYKILFKIAGIELNKIFKMNDQKEMSDFISKKFNSYFNFAINILKNGFDEPSILFLSIILQFMPLIRKFIPENCLNEIWSVVKLHEKFDWRLISTNCTDQEFQDILSDLLIATKKYLCFESDISSADSFEIWRSFFDSDSEFKKKEYQLKIQELFHYFHECDSFLHVLHIKKQISVARFFSFCLKQPKIILTSQMLDTIFQVLLRFENENLFSIEDYQTALIAQIEVGSFILSREYMWNKNKVHLTYLLFKHVLRFFLKRCEMETQPSKDDIISMSICAFSLEKWVSLMLTKGKDFARISSYFIVAIISAMASVTLPPAIKIHLVNCLNHFLSISDSHTVSYLLRTLKPGYQQLFNSIYDQFKKYHKYSGKV